MGSEERPIVDWVNLPEGVNQLNLGITLHDGDLIEIESDLLARTLNLRFDVGYVKEFHHFPEETRFMISIGGVQSVRSSTSVPWPGGCTIPAGTPHEQQQAIVAEYHRKWREESLSWADFERLIVKGFMVLNATLGQTPGGIALRLGLLVGPDSYVEAYVRGNEITFSIGNRQVSSEEFVEAGEAYWTAWDAEANKTT
jgi:hypothetical protein